MKPTKGLTVAVVCICLLGIVVFAFSFRKKPFRDLDSSEIESATVRLIPPDKTIQIMEKDQLADFLNDVVIYNRDDSYTEYDGQGVIFTLTMSDGTQTEIMAYNPFLVIDGVGYRTKYEPCNALNSFANRLLREEDVVVIMKEPPRLDVISDNTCHSALLGTYSWQSKNMDGTFTGVDADSMHPLDCKELLAALETEETTAILRFGEEPDAILNVCCWSDEHWSDTSADGEKVSVNGNEIELKPGAYIYEVIARWDTGESGYGGIAHYSFYVRVL